MSVAARFLARMLHRARQAYWKLFRPLTLGVSAMVLDSQSRVLLVRNSYRPGWHLPGGGVKRGETIAQAIEREVFEETGVRADREPREIWGVFSNFSDLNYDHVVVFVLRDCDFSSLKQSSFEISAVQAFSMDDLPRDIGPGSGRRIEEFKRGRIDQLLW